MHELKGHKMAKALKKRKCHLDFQGYWLENDIVDISPEPGIYCVYRCSYNSTSDVISPKELIYIGLSTNVRRRLLGHKYTNVMKKWKKIFPANDKLCFSYAYLIRANHSICETALLHSRMPKFNSNRKSPLEMHVNLQLKITGAKLFLPRAILFSTKSGSLLK